MTMALAAKNGSVLMTLRALPAALLLACLSSLAQADDRPVAVVTFSILGDFARQVAGEHVEVVSLVPRGAEVHEYELRPVDFRALENADLVFYNGLNLEQWMRQLHATVPEGVATVAMAAESGVDLLPIVTGGYAGDPDPHAWMDPRRAGRYVELIRNHLTELVPARESAFRANAERYRDELDDLYREMTESLAGIAPEHRLLITTEAAFVYFADAFGFTHDGIWGTNSETEGGSRQLMRITDLIEQRRPPAIFWESTLSSRYVESLSADTGVPYRGPLYVDSLGEPGSDADTYPRMMRANARVLREALDGG